MEYNIGGKIFLKKGGKYVPKMGNGGGDYYSSTYGSLNPNKYVAPAASPDSTQGDSFFKKMSPTAWGTMLDVGATALNSLAKKPQPGMSQRANIMGRSYTEPAGFEKAGAAALGVAGMLDPTGTMKMIDTGLKTGRAASNVINPGDEYGVSRSNIGEIAGNALDPLGRIQQSITVGKKHGFGEGVKDFLTFGVTGNKLMREDVKYAKNRDEKEDMQLRQGMNQGSYRNDSVYAKYGATIKPKYATSEPNVEIEDGEVVLGNPTRMGIRGNTSTSLESKYGAAFHGDKHGVDSDGDGMEGIPLVSGEAYVGSDYLGLDGKKAGPGNRSVASEMKPYLKFLNGGETNPSDPYKNNPVAIAETNRQLSLLKSQAEKGKFMEELSKQLKQKDRDVKSVLSFIAENAPMEDLSAEEQGQVQQISNQLNNSQNQNQQMYNQQMYRMGGHYMQQGGMAQPEANPSEDRMNALVQASPSLDPSQAPQAAAPAGGEQLSPEAMQALQQLPPEVQQQIMQLPVEQQEAAIMQAMQSMGGQQGAAPAAPGQMDPAMMEAPVDAAGAEMATEQGQPVMKCGGRMYRNGDYIRMKIGGSIREGRLAGMNSSTGAFNLQ